MRHAHLVSLGLALLSGCGGSQPASTGAVAFPAASTAVPVSSARFFSIDPDVTFNNSTLRNCRFGRTAKIPMVPSLVELRLDEVVVGGKSAGALTGGLLQSEQQDALASRLEAMATVNRTMAQSACHPWRGGPEDASMVPTLLIAADAQAPAASLEAVISAAWRGGFEEVALWVEAPGAMSTSSGAGTPLKPVGATVAALIGEVDAVRAGGDPCVLLTPRSDAGKPGEGSGGEGRVLSGDIPVVPVVQKTDRRLSTGEICGTPPAAPPEEVLDEL